MLRLADAKKIAFLMASLGLVSCRADHSPEAVALGRSKAGVKLICIALETFRDDNNRLPTAAEGLDILVGAPHDYLRKRAALIDGWGREIRPHIAGGVVAGAVSDGANPASASDDIACEVAMPRTVTGGVRASSLSRLEGVLTPFGCNKDNLPAPSNGKMDTQAEAGRLAGAEDGNS